MQSNIQKSGPHTSIDQDLAFKTILGPLPTFTVIRHARGTHVCMQANHPETTKVFKNNLVHAVGKSFLRY